MKLVCKVLCCILAFRGTAFSKNRPDHETLLLSDRRRQEEGKGRGAEWQRLTENCRSGGGPVGRGLRPATFFALKARSSNFTPLVEGDPAAAASPQNHTAAPAPSPACSPYGD